MKKKNKHLSAYEAAPPIIGYSGYKIKNKSSYIQLNPNNVIFFKACLVFNDQKFWYGDIDLTVTHKKLQKLSEILNGPIYIYSENANLDDIKKAFVKIDKNEIEFMGAFKMVCYIDNNGTPKLNDSPPLNSSNTISADDVDLVIKLPAVSKLQSSGSVLTSFMKAVHSTTPDINYGSLYVSKFYAMLLMVALMDEIKQKHPSLSTKEIETMAAWQWISLGPNCLEEDPEWMHDKQCGYVIKLR